MFHLPRKVLLLVSTRDVLNRIFIRLAATSPGLAHDDKEKFTNAKPYSQVPGPKGLPIIGTLWTLLKDNGYYQKRPHLLHAEYREKYGPIFKDKIVNFEMLFISTPEDAATLFSAEGKYPSRGPILPLVIYREQRKKPRGVFIG